MDPRAVVAGISLLLFISIGARGEGLSYNFYEASCAQVEDIVRAALGPIFLSDPTTPAALLRLMFHDCQVQGCDASILVDSSEGYASSEMASGRNFGVRKRETIGILKTMVEAECPKQVSCTDILVLAAREAVAMSGGPEIKVPLGRRDSIVAPSSKLADSLLSAANIGVDGTLHVFAKFGMTIEESVAILGAHTLGVTHCSNVLNRLNEAEDGHIKGTITPGFEAFLRLNCPQGSLASNLTFVLNDPTTATFDNHYYSNAIGGHGVLRVDAEMVMDPRTAPAVQQFAENEDYFFEAFSSAFVKLSSSGVLIGDQGVVRESCNAI
ncbi:putative peroxidase [Rosa chinensis]|uniref:Peroxidase n=1 Tax=Rosa chinensis TaxID=74649 RepID=A0A2P6QZ42_ROSCH|nr:peroxidase 29 [Rosa chinensis]PRQ39457.1 putative peroxidase [Rosa chinensis]